MKTGMSLRSICNFACLLIIAYPDKKPGCRFAPFAFPIKNRDVALLHLQFCLFT